MKIHTIMKKILFSLMAVAALTACNNVDDFPPLNPSDSDVIRVNASIGQMTRVATDGMASHFENGDKIMVYGWTGDKTTVPANPPIASVNTLTIENSVETWEAQPQMLWQSQTAAHYFIGIYPVRTVANFSADAYLLDETKQEDADLLVAVSDDQGIVANNRGVDLTFKHVMAKININMNFRNQWEATPTPSEVKLYCGKEATINYLPRTVTADAYVFDATKYIAMPVLGTPVTGFDKSYSSIVIPQTGVNMVDIVVDGIRYRYNGNEDIPFESGKVTTLNLNVGKDEITLAGVTVGDWEDGETIGGGEAEEVIEHPYVDFGLTSGTLWATYNVGATAPEEFGGYFAWGETQSKETYDWSNEGDYKYGVRDINNKPDGGMTKYNSTDNLRTLISSDDAASVSWGDDWRTPTKADFDELIEACDTQWTDDHDGTGVAGLVIRSKTDETKFIFLPAAGYHYNHGLDARGTDCKYWCSSIYETEYPVAWSLNVANDYPLVMGGNSRYYGFSIRPVRSVK